MSHEKQSETKPQAMAAPEAASASGAAPAGGAAGCKGDYLHASGNRMTVRHQPHHPVRLVVFDLDGTLLNPGQFISPRNRQALESLRAAGIGFTLASGRTEQHMRMFAEQLDVTLPVIACNGAVIYDHHTQKDVYREPMSEALALDILDHMLTNGLDFLCYTRDRIYCPAYSRKIQVIHLYNENAAREGSQLIRIATLDKPHILEAARNGLVKILALFGTQEGKERIEAIAARHQATVIASMSEALDIMAPDVSKGTGMAQLARILGVSLENVAAFGDHDNDASMIAMAGTGFAMGEATPAARAVADIIAPNCTDDGVAIAIESYILPSAGRL